MQTNINPLSYCGSDWIHLFCRPSGKISLLHSEVHIILTMQQNTSFSMVP